MTLSLHDEARRVRSPADILRFLVAAVAVVVVFLLAWLFGDSVVVFASDFLRGIDALPNWILTLLVAGVRLLTVAVLIGGLLWTAVRARWAAPIAMLLGGVIAAVLVALLADVADVESGRTVAMPDTDLAAFTSGWFPTAVGVGVLAATLTAGAPWLSRRWRRAGWAAVIGLALVRTLTSEMSFGSVQAWLIGWFAGAAALVAIGAPPRRAERRVDRRRARRCRSCRWTRSHRPASTHAGRRRTSPSCRAAIGCS